MTESNETDFRTNALKEWRILHVSHGVRWQTEPGVWRDEQFMFSVSDTRPDKSAGTRAVILSRDEAVALSKWLNKALRRKARTLRSRGHPDGSRPRFRLGHRGGSSECLNRSRARLAVCLTDPVSSATLCPWGWTDSNLTERYRPPGELVGTASAGN